RATALTGCYASVIGGTAAAKVVFSREVRKRANSDPRVKSMSAEVERSTDPASRTLLRARLAGVVQEVMLEYQAEVAAEFDAIHTVERALKVGSLEEIIEPAKLRPEIIRSLAEIR
ncbi:MAG: hypothetical protein Q8R92_19680, partial [Deltaproteobacteria bacterium]|nr:hypothetical protein [Deltaproteobacteria bacterium]